MKTIATLDTVDSSDCTAAGYIFTLYSDGHLSAEYFTRWQGSRNGARYITSPDHVDIASLDPQDPDRDALAALTAAVQEVEPSYDAAWRQVRRGHIVGR